MVGLLPSVAASFTTLCADDIYIDVKALCYVLGVTDHVHI